MLRSLPGIVSSRRVVRGCRGCATAFTRRGRLLLLVRPFLQRDTALFAQSRFRPGSPHGQAPRRTGGGSHERADKRRVPRRTRRGNASWRTRRPLRTFSVARGFFPASRFGG